MPLQTTSLEIQDGAELRQDECGALRRVVEGVKGCLTALNVISALLCLVYAWSFMQGISPYWFNRQWTTDDALQQAFPFHSVYHPRIFSGDLIAEAMGGYLAPLHYWLGYLITLAVKDPIMTCHWLMLVQVLITLGFLFFAIKHVVGAAPAWISVAWLLHTRTVMQRITGGLPRGWAAPVLAAYLFFALTKRNKGMLAAILCACLLHPPMALLIGLAHGLLLAARVLRRETRKPALRALALYLLCCPIYAAVTFAVVHRPPELGQMVDYETAASMPEFQYPRGRFPFLPLEPVLDDLKMYGFQPFFHRLHRPGVGWDGAYHAIGGWKTAMLWFIPLMLLAAWGVGRARYKRNIFPLELLCMGVAIAVVYGAARQFAFKLYVPNRHLQFPMTFLLIAVFCIVPWIGLHRTSAPLQSSRWHDSWRSALALGLIALLVAVGTGAGFDGSANFNFPLYKRGGAFAWLKHHTPETALVAGHPVHIDPVQLFAMRRGYATIETTHPFYLGYYQEMKRRLIISFKAHYARSLRELVELLRPEGVTHFLFARQRFYPEALKSEKSFEPLDPLVKELASRPPEDYAYKQLPERVDLVNAPYMPFKDRDSAIVDVQLLAQHLEQEDR